MRSSRSALATLVACAALVLGVTACGDGDEVPTSLAVTHAWARTTPPGAHDGVAYFTVTSPTDDALVGVSVPRTVARAAELHASMAGGESGMANMPNMDMGGDDDTMTMKPLRSVPLDAGKAVTFEPGGRHVMLVDLADSLDAGEVVTLTLRFRHAPDRRVQVRVADNPPD